MTVVTPVLAPAAGPSDALPGTTNALPGPADTSLPTGGTTERPLFDYMSEMRGLAATNLSNPMANPAALIGQVVGSMRGLVDRAHKLSQQAAKKAQANSGSTLDVVHIEDLHGGPAVASLETDTGAGEVRSSAAATSDMNNVEQLIDSLSDSLEFDVEATLVAIGTGQFTHTTEAVIRGQ